MYGVWTGGRPTGDPAGMRRRIGIAVGFLVLVLAGAWLWLRPHGASIGREVTETGVANAGVEALRPKTMRKTNGNVLVAPRAAVRGTIRDPSGTPILGATVCAITQDSEAPTAIQREPACVRSGPGGQFTITGLYPVEYRVSASAPQHRPGIYVDAKAPRSKRSTLRLGPGQVRTGVDIVLEHGGVLVRGVVKDLAGGPIAGAWVVVYREGGGEPPSASAVTDDEGAFEVWCAPGDVVVRATADGYTQAERQGIAPGQTFELFLTPASTLVGTVVRADSGAPVEGAEVLARKLGDLFKRAQGRTRSDGEGRFRIEGIEPGTYKVEAILPEAFGLAQESAHVGLAETSQPIVVRVHAAYSLAGRVVIGNAQGDACPSGRVVVDAAGTDASRWGSVAPDGSVQLHALFPGRYRVKPTCDGYVSEAESPEIEITAANVEDRVWIVQPGLAIRGHVVYADGSFATGINVYASPKMGGTDPRARRTDAYDHYTDATGVFELTGLLPGVYTLEARGRGLPKASPEPVVELVAGHDLDDVRIELPAVGMLRGVVRDDRGAPQGGVSLHVTSETSDRSGMVSSAIITTDEGRFELAHLAAGVAHVSVWTRNGESLPTVGQSDDGKVHAEIEAGAITELELVVRARDGTIRGRVIDADGVPVLDAFIDVEREQGGTMGSVRRRMSWFSSFRAPILTDTEGRFTLERLADGTYVLWAYRQGGGEAVLEGVVAGSDVTITLERPGVLAGTVSIEGGVPPERFTIHAQASERGITLEDAFFRTNGAWRLTNVPPGKYEVQVESNDGAAKLEVELAPGEDETHLVLALERPVLVTGTLVDAETGEPVPGMRIVLANLAGVATVSDDVPDRRQISDAEGRFTIERVAPGKRSLYVAQLDGRSTHYVGGNFTVEIPSGVPSHTLAPITLVRRE